MPGSLIQRYMYGNFATYPALPPESDFFGLPARHREVVQIARAQIAVQQQAAAAIVQSNMESADLICREIREQTQRLEDSLREGAEAVVAAVADLGSRVVGELVEIRWELIQLNATAGQLLEVLRRPRSTEASELLSQGLRNLINDKIEQAEERFLRALELDNTDYQVLMNLSGVALRKGEAEHEMAYLKDALTLPESLDARSKAEALWSLARIRYALEDYAAASEMARLSLELVSEPRRILQRGAYCILAGQMENGQALIAQAIEQDRGLFAVAASLPDFATSQEAILGLLGKLGNAKLNQLRGMLIGLDPKIKRLSDLRSVDTHQLQAFSTAHQYVQRLAESPSYSTCCSALVKVGGLWRAIEALAALDPAAREVSDAECREQQARREVEAALSRDKKGRRLSKIRTFASCVSAAMGLLMAISFINLLDKMKMKETAATVEIAFFSLFVLPLLCGGVVYLLITIETARREHQLSDAEGAQKESQTHLAEARSKYMSAEKALRDGLYIAMQQS
jgi:tetratricopeptide (TPR) repeat protein